MTNSETGRGAQRGRRRSASPPPSGPEQERLIGAWFAGRVPDTWFDASPTIVIDSDEVQVVGVLAPPQLPEGAGEDQRLPRGEPFRSDADRRRGPAGVPSHRLVGCRVRGLPGALHHGRGA